MNNSKLRRPRKLKAFTLLEMIVVMAIIGILASIIIPSTVDQMRSSRIETANVRAEEIYRAAQNYLTDKQIKRTELGTGGKVGILVKSDSTGAWDLTCKFGDTIIDDDADSKEKFKKGISNYIGPTTIESLMGGGFFLCFDADTYTADYVLYCEDNTMLDASTGIVKDLTKDNWKAPYTQVFGRPEAGGRSQEYDTNNTDIRFVGQYPVGK